MRRSMSRDAALKQALRQMVAGATRLLVIMEATDFSEARPMARRGHITVTERIENILRMHEEVDHRLITLELGRDGHRDVSQGCVSGILNKMKLRGQIAYAEGKWRLVADEPATAEAGEQ